MLEVNKADKVDAEVEAVWARSSFQTTTKTAEKLLIYTISESLLPVVKMFGNNDDEK